MKTNFQIDPQCHSQLVGCIESDADLNWREDLCASVPQLLDLMSECHDVPMDTLAPAIRAILIEHCRIGPAGHPQRLDDEDLQRHVDLLVSRLEALRQAQVHSGSWSETPAAMQFFG